MRVGRDTDWATVAAGSYHALAVKRDGSLWAWGGNHDGKLGDGTTAHHSAPVRIGTGTDWTSSGAGSSHTLAIGRDGTLWAWGADFLASGTVPVRVGSDADWGAVAAGSGFSLAIKRDGALWAWGGNGDGQLGDGTTTPFRSALVPVRMDAD